MANYSDGTITIVEGSADIVGVGTKWLSSVKPGQYLTVDGLLRPHQVGLVVDDTHITLTRPIAITGDPESEFTLWKQSYTVIDSYTGGLSIPIVGKDNIDKQPRLVRMINLIDTSMATVIGWQVKNGSTPSAMG